MPGATVNAVDYHKGRKATGQSKASIVSVRAGQAAVAGNEKKGYKSPGREEVPGSGMRNE